MNIIFYSFNFYPRERGGMEKYLRILIDKLRVNHNITLILPNRHNYSIEKVKIYNYYELFPEKKVRNIIYYLLNSISYLLSIFILTPQIAIKEKAKMISGFNFGIDFLFIQIIMKFFRKKIITNIRGISSLNKKRDFILKDLSLFFTDFITINSKDLIDRYKKFSFLPHTFINNKKTFYLPNGINTSFWKKEKSNGTNIIYDLVFVGNIKEITRIIDKGFKVFYDAINIIKEKYNKILRVLIIGEYNLINIKKILEIFDEKNFIFKGKIKSKKLIKKLLLKAKIFVLPSISEGMPNSLMEAMSLGMPCVASNVGAVSSLITNKKDGLIFNSGDSYSLAEQIWMLLNDIDLQNNLGKYARLKMKLHFDWEKSIQRVLRCYKIIEKS